MARPKGYRLNRPALEDLLKARGLSMTEFAERNGMPLTTLSSLATGDSRASVTTVRKLVDGLSCQPATLFPEYGNFDEREPVEVAS